MATKKFEQRQRRKMRIRKKIFGMANCPRLTVFRSKKNIYAQLINDESQTVICAASSIDKEMEKKGGKNCERAKEVGILIARRAKEKMVTRIVFDRNGYLYHGKIKELADACRENGLVF